MVVRLTDADLERLGRRGAVDAMRAFLAASSVGRTAAPPRVSVTVGQRTLVFTVGGDLDQGLAGFRLYSTGGLAPPPDRPDQVLALLDLATGEILATAEGAAFGAWRTSAIGGVALEEALRGRPQPVRAAILGAGLQAHHHARTWAATRRVSEFAVWARRPDAGAAFATSLQRETGIPARAFAEAHVALEGASAVLCATTSPTAVFSADALPSDAYVATLGHKFGGRSELPEEAFARAVSLVSDAPAQVVEYERTRGPLAGGRRAQEVLPLADVAAGKVTLPAKGVRIFVSEGLAGTEVALMGALVRARRGAAEAPAASERP